MREGLGWIGANSSISFRGSKKETAIIKCKVSPKIQKAWAQQNYDGQSAWNSWDMLTENEIVYERENGFFPIPYQTNINMR